MADQIPTKFPGSGWRLSEEITQTILCMVRPTRVSEGWRKDVVEYVQRLVKSRLDAEVFAFGSVPLKTYLSDGDIDLTVICNSNSVDNLARDVLAVLKEEENNIDAYLEVKDVQYINAEVKLVKCLIGNIIVDISFNQIGGLRTLCFLEKVDILVGKDNLFKRSIILVKAWCYYESRILGAHHALLSTYALEIMVLYIFHFFHSSLDGPLSVLYKFLEYFSNFDWDKFCISLSGPVRISSLPDKLVEPPENDGANLLFSVEFLNTCGERVSVPPRASENTNQSFFRKHLNIIDPLRDNNNLGRSVSRGNFYRIRSAFTYGAKMLHQVLSLSGQTVENELHKFFASIVERYSNGEWPNLQHVPRDKHDDMPLINVGNAPKEGNAGNNSSGNTRIPSFIIDFHGRMHGYTIKVLASPDVNIPMDTKHLASERSMSYRSMNEKHTSKESTVHDTLNRAQHGSHFKYHWKDGLPKESTFCRYKKEHISSCNGAQISDPGSEQTSLSSKSTGGVAYPDQVSDAFEYCSLINMDPRISWACELVQLSGDDSCHRKNLIYAQWCHDHTSNVVPSGNQSTYFHDTSSADAPSIHTNGVIPSTQFSSDQYHYTKRFDRLSGFNGISVMPKKRGTGTFIPNPMMTQRAYRERPPRRETNTSNGFQGLRPSIRRSAIIQPHQRSVHFRTPLSRCNNTNQSPPCKEYPKSDSLSPLNIRRNGCEKPYLSEIPYVSDPDLLNGSPKSSGIISAYRQLEFGTFKSAYVTFPVPNLIPEVTSNPETSEKVETNDVHSDKSSTSSSSEVERPVQPYYLQDNEDFPPLSGQLNPTQSAKN